MRTIKFKGKSLMNGQWVTGDLAHSLDGKLNILGFVEEEGKIGFTGAHKIDPPPSASSLASLTKTARRFMKATCCARTNIRIAVSKTTSATTIMP